MALHRAGDEVELSDDAQLALAIDEQFAVAREARNARIERVPLLLADAQALCKLVGCERDARIGEFPQHVAFGRGDVYTRFALARGRIAGDGCRTSAQRNCF